MYKWKNNSPLKSIYGAEAILLSKNILEKYIEISVNIKNKMIDGKSCYGYSLKNENKNLC